MKLDMENGMEWNGNFGMEYGDARMDWNARYKNGMEDNLPYFHTIPY